MNSIWLYYVWAVALLLANGMAWCLNFIALPGNWLIVLFSALFAWLVGTEEGPGVSWPIVGVALLLAILGELAEMIAGAAGAARQGASRRSLVLSVVGSILGSVAGVIIGLPIPVVGSAVAALVGGALGAFAGAALGEDWKGRGLDESLAVGTAAFWGRILGTTGKLICGAMMVAIVTVDSLW